MGRPTILGKMAAGKFVPAKPHLTKLFKVDRVREEGVQGVFQEGEKKKEREEEHKRGIGGRFEMRGV
jgi:hypothetical protein